MPPEPNHDYQELLKLNESLREIVDKELVLKERAAELLRQELLRQSPRNLYRQVDEDPEKMIYSNIPWLVDTCLRHIGFVERFQKVSERCGQPLKNIKDAEERLEELLKNNPPRKSRLRRQLSFATRLLIGAAIGAGLVYVGWNLGYRTREHSLSPAVQEGPSAEHSLRTESGNYKSRDENVRVPRPLPSATVPPSDAGLPLELKIISFTCGQKGEKKDIVSCSAELNRYERVHCYPIVGKKTKSEASFFTRQALYGEEQLKRFEVGVTDSSRDLELQLSCSDGTSSVTRETKLEPSRSLSRSLSPRYQTEHTKGAMASTPSSRPPSSPYEGLQKKARQMVGDEGRSSPSWTKPALPPQNYSQPASPRSEQPRSSVGQPQWGQVGALVPPKRLMLYNVREEYQAGEIHAFSFGAAEGRTPEFWSCSLQGTEDLVLKYDVSSRKITMFIPKSESGEYNLQVECESPEGKFKSENKTIRITPFKSSPFGNSHNDD